MDTTKRATVGRTPGSESAFVIIKPGWYADCQGETAPFGTREEAVAFCWQRWGVRPDQIRFKGTA